VKTKITKRKKVKRGLGFQMKSKKKAFLQDHQKKSKTGDSGFGKNESDDVNAIPGENYGRRRLPEGFEPFNMNEEMATGKFDEKTGGYISTVKEERETDPWLLELDKKKPEEQQYKPKKKGKNNTNSKPNPLEALEDVEILEKICAVLQSRENVFTAMRRLKPDEAKRGNNRNRKGSKQNAFKRKAITNRLEKQKEEEREFIQQEENRKNQSSSEMVEDTGRREYTKKR